MGGKALFVLIVFSLVSACGKGSGDPAVADERYLRAKVAGDDETVRRLLCREMENDFEREMRSFEGVSQARLEGAACEIEGDGSIVRCHGKIVAAYGGEQSEFPLTAYRVTWEEGEWKWCGEAP